MTGGVLTGDFGAGTDRGAASNTPAINAWNGTYVLSFIPRTTAGSFNALVQADDGMIFRNGPGGNGANSITIAPYNTTALGVRISAPTNTVRIAAGTITVDGSTRITGTCGFNNTAPIAKPAVSGSRSGNAALAALLTALANYGLLTDSTTA